MWFVSWKKVPGAVSEPIPEYPIATMEPLTVLVLYSLRFCVIFSVVILWVVAVSDVGSHIRKGSFTAAQLVSMAVAVSVIAVGAIVALNATVPSHGGTGLDQKGPATVVPAGQRCEAFSYTFTYSFGLRGSTSMPQECVAGHAAESHSGPSGLPGSCGQERGCRSRGLDADATAFSYS
jgi:hypothetical protein